MRISQLLLLFILFLGESLILSSFSSPFSLALVLFDLEDLSAVLLFLLLSVLGRELLDLHSSKSVSGLEFLHGVLVIVDKAESLGAASSEELLDAE